MSRANKGIDENEGKAVVFGSGGKMREIID
jgi:hypothetical protein